MEYPGKTDDSGRSRMAGLHVIGDARTGFSGLIAAAAEGAACAEPSFMRSAPSAGTANDRRDVYHTAEGVAGYVALADGYDRRLHIKRLNRLLPPRPPARQLAVAGRAWAVKGWAA